MAARTVAIDGGVLRRLIGVGIARPPIARVRSATISAARVISSTFEVSRTTVPELRGHFPRLPVVPAIVILEAIFQSAAAAVPHLAVGRVKSAAFRKPTLGLGSVLEISIARDTDEDGDEAAFYRAVVKERKSDETVADVKFIATEIE